MSELQNKIDELRKKLESIPLANDVKLAFKDNMDKALELIKKLDSKMEKKEDSEVLKKIKEIAREEGEFYDKHGYFSFWSDKLKAQRIKEAEDIKKLAEKKFLDLGMISSKNGELSEYSPSQFIKDYAKEHSLFSLIGLLFPLEDSGAEKARSLKIRTAGRDKASLNESGGDEGLNPSENSKASELSECDECGGHLFSGYLLHKGDCSHLHDKQEPREKPPEPTNEEIIFDAGPPCETCKHNSGIDESYCNPCVRGTNYEPREDDLYELYLKDGDQYYFKKTTHPFTEYNNMVNLGIGEMKMKREDSLKLYNLASWYVGSLDREHDLNKVLKRIKEEYKIE